MVGREMEDKEESWPLLRNLLYTRLSATQRANGIAIFLGTY